MLLIPSMDVAVESRLAPAEFVARLTRYVDSVKSVRKLSEGKFFLGEVGPNGNLNLIYCPLIPAKKQESRWRGPQLFGTVSEQYPGSKLRMRIRLPKSVLIVGLIFGWGSSLFGLTGMILMALTSNVSVPGLLFRAIPLSLVPCAITYALFYLILNDSASFIKEFFEENFKS